MMENNTPFLSIIMPAYNSENEIENAIRSIISQKFQDWELLIVDDCSTDHTCEVINKFVNLDSRISLFRKEKNEGPGKAKNLGLKKAKGKYVTFCDGDDWVEKDAYYEMTLGGTLTYDVLSAGFYRDICDESGKVLESNLVFMPTFEIFKKNDVLKMIPLMDQNRLFSYAVNKLYSKQIVDQYNVRFSDKKFGEDFDYNIDFFKHVESVLMLEKGYYHYIKKNMESLTERYIPDFFEINKDRFQKMINLLKDNHCYYEDIQQTVLSSYIKHAIAAITRLYDKRAVLPEKRSKIVKNILSDELSTEAMRYAKANGKKEMICNTIFKTNNVMINLVFGKLLWFMQNYGKKLYEHIK